MIPVSPIPVLALDNYESLLTCRSHQSIVQILEMSDAFMASVRGFRVHNTEVPSCVKSKDLGGIIFLISGFQPLLAVSVFWQYWAAWLPLPEYDRFNV